jgi:hypothetical protein
MYVIRCRGIAGRNDPDPIVGQYLKDNDFEHDEGRGRAAFTPNLKDAMTFPDKAAAMAYYFTASKTVPRRPDGRPNRPLTAYMIEITEA